MSRFPRPCHLRRPSPRQAPCSHATSSRWRNSLFPACLRFRFHESTR
jgi:hypothetical protein